MTYRSRRHLALAHIMPCMALFPHGCNSFKGCVPMHADFQIFGRGIGHKTPDWAWAAGCPEAHRILTAKVNDDMKREQKFYDWLRAYVKTQDYLWANKLVRLA